MKFLNKIDGAHQLKTDASNRLVTDAEKSNWNAKQDKLIEGANIQIAKDGKTISATDTKYTHPAHTAKSSGFYKVAVDNLGHVTSTTNVTKTDITNLGIPAQDTIVDISGKVDKVVGKNLSTNDYTTAEKDKLSDIETGANKYTHPSTHPYSMITGVPTSLPANGGNADTVDGYHLNQDIRTTASPWFTKLGVGSSGTAYGVLEIKPGGTNSTGIAMYRGTGTTSREWLDTNDTWNHSRGSGTPFLSYTTAGNIGVGTTTPNEKLDIVGNARIRSEGSMKFGGTGASDSAFEIKYNNSTKSLDFNFLL